MPRRARNVEIRSGCVPSARRCGRCTPTTSSEPAAAPRTRRRGRSRERPAALRAERRGDLGARDLERLGQLRRRRGPPACASESRPPPPPPTTAAAALTTAPALTPRSTAPGEAATSSETRPPAPLPSTTTDGSPSWPRSLSAASGIAFASAKSACATSTRAPPTSSAPSAETVTAAAPPPPDFAAFSSSRRLASRSATAAATFSGDVRSTPAASVSTRSWSAQQLDPDRAGDRLDPAHVRRARRLGRHLEHADLGGRAHVRAAAQLARPGAVADLDHAHDVAVLLAEQRGRAERLRLVERRRDRAHRVVGEDPVVDLVLDVAQLVRARPAGRA